MALFSRVVNEKYDMVTKSTRLSRSYYKILTAQSRAKLADIGTL
jgi:hypothetical protein